VRALPTLVEVLQARAQQQPEHRVLTFVEDGGAEHHVTIAELHCQARRIAALLQNVNAVGRPVIIALPPGALYNSAVWGCMYAGAIAVPVYPPYNALSAGRLAKIAADSGAELALSSSAMVDGRKRLEEQVPALAKQRWLLVDQVAAGTEAMWQPEFIDPNALALLQYTSGSTGDPKGVMLSHANLQANMLALLHAGEGVCGLDFRAQDRSGADRGLSWLPPYHDMGLSAMLSPIIGGAHSFQYTPLWFVRRPERWVQTIGQRRIAMSVAPNFAYDMAADRAGLLSDAELDLSGWRVAVTGAEPVRKATIERFCAAFGRFGFREESFRPSYGMAEATVFISCADRSDQPLYCHVDRDALLRDRVRPQPAPTEATQTLVGCGWPQGGQEVLIVDPDRCVRVAPDVVGEIWLRGPNVARGYHGKPELSRAVFGALLEEAPSDGDRGPFMRTGDKGFWHKGQLFVTGRIKETIIIRGKNFYPADLELAAQRRCEALAPHGGAAFAVTHDDGERLVLVHELARRRVEADAVAEQVQAAIVRDFGIRLHELVLIAPRALPRTSSGKPQRSATRNAYQAQQLSVVHHKTWAR
jgi:acyl-CoA synthetase (AMP-forming)/AMP-acid ligase II